MPDKKVRISLWWRNAQTHKGKWFKHAVYEGPLAKYSGGSCNGNFLEHLGKTAPAGPDFGEGSYDMWAKTDNGTWTPILTASSTAWKHSQPKTWKGKLYDPAFPGLDWGTTSPYTGQDGGFYLAHCDCNPLDPDCAKNRAKGKCGVSLHSPETLTRPQPAFLQPRNPLQLDSIQKSQSSYVIHFWTF